jgi:AraC-like DNA-binding protein
MPQDRLDIVLQLNDISNTERVILLILAQRATLNRKTNSITIDDIASSAGISISTTKRAIKNLLGKKYVMSIGGGQDVCSGRRKIGNRYLLSFLPDILEFDALLQELAEFQESKYTNAVCQTQNIK